MATEKDRERLRELRAKLERIRAIKPVKNTYRYEGQNLTVKGFQGLIKETEKEIDKLERATQPSPSSVRAAERQAESRARADALKARKKLNLVSDRRKDLEKAARNARTVEEQTNLNNWVALFKKNESDIQAAIRELEAGRLVPNVPEPIDMISVDSAKKQSPAGPQFVAAPAGGVAPTPGVAYGGMPRTTTTGLTAGQRQEENIMPGAGQPAVAPDAEKVDTRTQVETEIPAGLAVGSNVQTAPPVGMQPGGAYVTDPATGQQVYLPPNIDFAALAAANPIPADWEKAAREMFGTWYEVFKNDPEMSAFLQRLMRQPEMSDAMFMAELQKTKWWRQTNAKARDYARRQVEDPATLNQEISNKVTELRQMALDRGFAVDDKSLNDAALKSIQFGFSDQSVLNHLAQLTIETAQGPSSLLQGYYGQNVRETAARFGVPLSQTTLTKWTSDIATGNQSLNSFEAYARNLAKNLYPSLSNGFDRGLTFTELTDPYAQTASRILEIPSTQIDFTDPKWAAAFTMKDAKGEQTQMSFGEWADYLRADPRFGWEYTDDAKNRAYTVVNRLAELFGAA